MPDNSDPLIAALFAKLPKPGTDWPEERQAAWLKMMAMALSVVYGGDVAPEPEAPRVANGSAAPAAPKSETPRIKYKFVVDEQGFAMKANGKRILPNEVSDVLYDLRGEKGDLRAITWADDSTGLPGSVMVSAVMS